MCRLSPAPLSLVLSFSLSLSCARNFPLIHRRYSNVSARRPLRPNVHLLLLPVRTRLVTHTHARTRWRRVPRRRCADTRIRELETLGATTIPSVRVSSSVFSSFFSSSLSLRTLARFARDNRHVAPRNRERVPSREHRAGQRRYALRFSATYLFHLPREISRDYVRFERSGTHRDLLSRFLPSSRALTLSLCLFLTHSYVLSLSVSLCTKRLFCCTRNPLATLTTRLHKSARRRD